MSTAWPFVDRLLQDRVRGAEGRHPFVRADHPDPAAALGKIGEQLVLLMRNQDKAAALVRHIYLRYVASCERHGVEPKPYALPRGSWRAAAEGKP